MSGEAPRPAASPGTTVPPSVELAPEEAARRLEQALTAADSAQTLDLDRAVLRLLADGATAGGLLEVTSLDALATMAGRWLHRLEQGDGDATRAAWELLEVVRRRSLRRRIAAAGAAGTWADLVLGLVRASGFTFARLLDQQARALGPRPLFRLAGPDGPVRVTWAEAAERIDLIARGLLALAGADSPPRVAVLASNGLETALLDLACLSSGIVNVLVPATATERDVAYALEHARADTVVCDAQQLPKVLGVRERLPELRTVILADAEPGAAGGGVIGFDRVLAAATATPAAALAERRRRISLDELATVMYTSGTTGTPKGICFSHLNIVFKRFARALALPSIGEGDRFLCYLPLYHTFGRFLELGGCVFWGATYCFAEGTSIETLIRQMAEVRPTVFISIPIRWTQLHEAIAAQVDLAAAADADIDATVRRLTGGELRWGLSAAGYLDPEVFRFFARHGVELMSGFGMTEATGGITMTPPGGYRDDSLGRPLPGIEIRLGRDGELEIRGPYVMMGYLDPPDGADPFDTEGWFATGDLMEMDADGYVRIVDRKKEIYKNLKGQTIAPQKIETLFREFDSVGRIFLVGDHREFNTALIYPRPGADGVDLSALSPPEVKAHFRSLVVSANSFLAPFERIVDFAVIDRDLSAEHGELTPKGSLRRKVIERNFSDQIRLLYRRATLMVGGAQVTLPNWLFQALGITAQEVEVKRDRLRLPSLGTTLQVRRLGPSEVQVGSVRYRGQLHPLDLGLLLSTPRLWLGNRELVDFAPLSQDQRDRRRGRADGIDWAGRVRPHRPRARERNLPVAALRQPATLHHLHRAALLLASPSPEDAVAAIDVLERGLSSGDPEIVDAALAVLRRSAAAPSQEVARRGLLALATAERGGRYHGTLGAFLARGPAVVDAACAAALAELELSDAQLDAFVEAAQAVCLERGPDATMAAALLHLLSAYGAAHPTRYRGLRAFMTRMALTAPDKAVRTAARSSRRALERGFRHWLGLPTRIAVDPETGSEYRWEDVVTFSDEVEEGLRERVLDAIRSTPLLREAVFLFAHGNAVRLDDILPHGVWVRLLGSDHGKSVLRVAVKTRSQEHYDLAINLNRGLSPRAIGEEVDWLILCSENLRLGALVEDFGGYWPDHDLWTEEFIAGETLDRALRRLAARPEDEERLLGVWPFAAWSALAAYLDFWNRTGRRLEIADPGPSNVIVPMHDYHSGARLVSISARRSHRSPAGLLGTLWHELVLPVERAHSRLAGLVGADILFSALLEIVGEPEGAELLRTLTARGATVIDRDMGAALDGFLDSLRRRGFLHRRLFFAVKRYRRWRRLNPDATRHARASTLHELFRTYRLADLQGAHPETRPRFFRETVFRDAEGALKEGLDDLIARLRDGSLPAEELSDAVASLRTRLPLEPETDYFLTRLSFPYLRPEDDAAWVAAEAGGAPQSEMVVTLRDREGRPYHVRHALTAKEVARLHRLFVAARLPVQFRSEHRFLVAVGDRGHLLGGLFYEVQPEMQTAHMDKVVVAEPFHGQGIAGALLEELSNRLGTAGYRSLTTGFFRPEFFYRYGFTVERRYAGLVKTLSAGPRPDQG